MANCASGNVAKTPWRIFWYNFGHVAMAEEIGLEPDAKLGAVALKP